MISKSCMITICGRPNVGKSTLANALAGEKVAIVSDKPQTTRNRITAVVNRAETKTQLVLMDTPGFHRPRTKLGDYMVNVVRESIPDVELVLLVVEPIPAIGPQEQGLIDSIRKSGCPAILVINKIDTVEKETLLAVMAVYAKAFDFAEILPVSAQKRDGTEELLRLMERYAVPGPAYFPEGVDTDQPDRQVCAELVREKLLRCLDREIPHGTAVEVTRFSERENGVIDLDVTIYCEKSSHKGIIIGKNGAMLKTIGEAARRDIERFMGTKVFLRTWVKVKENWRDSDAMLKNFGYGGAKG